MTLEVDAARLANPATYADPDGLNEIFTQLRSSGQIVRTDIEKMAAMDGECDFAKDVAFWYPLRVVNSILGLPESVFSRPLSDDRRTSLIFPCDH